MLGGMGHNAHRLSIEWSRIEPSPGAVDAVAIDHYRDVLGHLHAGGMTPLVTLHHFTNPHWFARQGGWESADSVDAFLRFVRVCAESFGDLVPIWSTFNEPNVYAYLAYFLGQWPPQHRDFRGGVAVLLNMLRAHARAYALLKEAGGGGVQVGIAHSLRVFDPARAWLPLDRFAAAMPNRAYNHWFLRGCSDGRPGWPLGGRVPEAAGTLDYIGVNYYSRDMVAFAPLEPANLFSRTFPRKGSQLSDFGMEIYPEGLHRLLVEVWRRYKRPIYVTENGVADAVDRFRPSALISHIAEMGRAIQAGVDVRGYIHWTSMDNFEWAEGFSMRFGLVEVDFTTQARTPRPSAALYSDIIRANGLSQALLREHYPRAIAYFSSSTDSSRASAP